MQNMRNYNVYWSRLLSLIEFERWKVLYDGLFYLEIFFRNPYVQAIECEILSLAIMRLLMKYVSNIDAGYIKLTIGLNMKIHSGEVTLTIGKSIPLFDESGKLLSKKDVYGMIMQLLMENAEKQNKALIKSVFIRVYHTCDYSLRYHEFPIMEDKDLLIKIVDVLNLGIGCVEQQSVKVLRRGRKNSSKYITAIKPKIKKKRPFLVADTETLLLNHVHMPYAMGYLVVSPGDDVGSKTNDDINLYFSESHLPFYESFEKRSERMIYEFLNSLEEEVNNKK